MPILESGTNCLKGGVYKAFNKIGLEKFYFPVSILTEFGYTLLSKLNFGSNATPYKLNSYISDFKTNIKLAERENDQLLAVVTGANSGVGYETAKSLAYAGYVVIMACRNKELTEKAISDLKTETGLDSFKFMELNLASFKSIRKFLESFKAQYTKLDLLINNAGVMMCPYMTTEDGLELQFGTNHVGHFILTNGLLNEIKAAKRARILCLSSIAQFTGVYDKSLVLESSKYDKVVNYGISKLANAMFARELSKRLEGTGVTVNSLHPGAVDTNLNRHLGITAYSIGRKFLTLFLLSPAAGSLTSVKLALSSEYEGVTGKYFEHEHEMVPKIEVDNPELCKDLWDFTEELIATYDK
ncbi:Retinol dehydrogenase 13 [Zancudomyces culisetae]|uniref:Retinol dehydrogenase 13 n=1 Tax=Zancudomyces culisetae TaxID=1213189 RepID=A0A1R1PH85_ZANCU|nr:Retinol dehydrogenase 13 [Zancudomyces culisetae]OMH80308.1 Retinol dehydrogenase 13 [Zancudomyces culisetae]|eukprot:OMH78901.1 Retinol dehydrogenase 13 [Zancudomyces culisetae]